MPGSAGVVKNTPTLICKSYENNATAATIVDAGTKVALCGIFFAGTTAGDYIQVHKGGDATTLYALPRVQAAGQTYLSFPHPILCEGLGVTIYVSASCQYCLVYAEV